VFDHLPQRNDVEVGFWIAGVRKADTAHGLAQCHAGVFRRPFGKLDSLRVPPTLSGLFDEIARRRAYVQEPSPRGRRREVAKPRAKHASEVRRVFDIGLVTCRTRTAAGEIACRIEVPKLLRGRYRMEKSESTLDASQDAIATPSQPGLGSIGAA